MEMTTYLNLKIRTNRNLHIVNKLRDSLHKHGIKYCHWKSNEHLEAAVQGITDLDILFDANQYNQVLKIMNDSGYQLFIAPWYSRYDGIVDFIGIDRDTGRLVHIHAHFKLVLGEKGMKSYHLPWEEDILATRIKDPGSQIFCSAPELELLLLMIRYSFKFQKRVVRNTIHNSDISNYQREADWLKKRVAIEVLIREARARIGEQAVPIVEKIYYSEVNEMYFRELERIIKNRYKSKRRYGTVHSFLRRYIRKTFYNYRKILFKIGISDYVPRRTISGRGSIISFLGADGSGKSTLSAAISRELRKKIDVLYLYMGSGGEPVSLQRHIVRNLIRMSKVIIKARNGGNKYNTFNNNHNPRNNSIIKQVKLFLLCLTIAHEKRSKLKKAFKAKNKGVIVICDRYPQTSIMGYNDGPGLSDYLKSSNIILRSLAAYEYKSYAKSRNISPNLVIKLLGNPHTLLKRKPEMNIEQIIKKQRGIENLSFDKSIDVIKLDAEACIEDIFVQSMREVGSNLVNNH
jgi:thymidylate kinase